MENMGDWEQKNLVNELTQGRELARQLQIHLNVPSSSYETREFLVQKILVSYEKALSMIHGSISSAGEITQPTAAGTSTLAIRKSESPPSLNGSPRSDQDSDHDQDFNRDASRKRKSLPRWTQQVRVSPGMGLEGPLDDGFSWRKYGQKDILGAKYPRGYYRCTHRNVQHCFATKQVQRSDKDPTIFEITYRGKHTCTQSSRIVPPSSSSQQQQQHDQTQEPNNSSGSSMEPHQQQQNYQTVTAEQNQKQTHDVLSNFRAGLRVITEDLEKINRDHDPQSFSSFHFPLKTEIGDGYFSSIMETSFVGGFSSSPSFISPATSGTNFFSVSSQGGINNHDQFGGNNQDLQTGFESDEKISVPITSATNSPTVGTDPFPFDPNFAFDNAGHGFFS
ncbi:probable WRKY transcription factor 53 [Ziziphus jujuba]|nr:probable WRKY transcription factor 53 [Ziziphus jujuba]